MTYERFIKHFEVRIGDQDITLLTWFFIILGIGLLISASVHASNVTDVITSAKSQGSNYADDPAGVKAVPNQNITIKYIINDFAHGAPDFCHVRANPGGAILANGSFAGTNGSWCPINYNLTKGTSYIFDVTWNDTSHTLKNVGYQSMTWPQSGTMVNFTKGSVHFVDQNEWYAVYGIYSTNESEIPPIPPTVNYTLNTTQYPSDINSSTDGTVTINATATISGTVFNDSDYAILYYKPYTALNAQCSIFYAKQCHTGNAFQSITMTKVNNSLFTIGLDDDEYFPAYYPFNPIDFENTIHSNYTAYQGNSVRWNVFNFSTNVTDFFITLEFDAVNRSSTTASLLIYYCNSSYSTGNPLLSSNCVLVDSFLPQILFQHIHNQSREMIIPVTIRNVTKTQNSTFIFVSPNILPANGWNFGYITNTSYDNQSFMIGNFNSWTATNDIFDMHIHSFLASDYFTYYAQLFDNGTTTTSPTTYDFYNITNFAPSAPLLLSPCDLSYTLGSSTNAEVFYNWTPSFDINGDTFFYHLYYDGANQFILTSANTSLTLSFSIAYPTGIYNAFVTACDSFNNCDTSNTCQFTLCRSNYVKSFQPCVGNARVINYTDTNHCSVYGYDLPADSGTYEACSFLPDKTSAPDVIILVILGFMIIIGIVCALVVNPMFFFLTALMFALMLSTFIYYGYPEILFLITGFMVLIFVVMAVVIKKN